jgi:P27 family predicted phage terminase small subunit
LDPPEHLSPDAQTFWRTVVTDYDLEPWHTKILQAACEAYDRMCEAREIVAHDGPVYRDRFGAPRRHPAVAVEQDARLAMLRALRELDLDGSAVPESRPPRR